MGRTGLILCHFANTQTAHRTHHSLQRPRNAMHEHELSLSIIPKRYEVFGLPMRDYSIGHEIILTREQNPFLEDVQLIERDKVAEAAFVCCQTWSENRDSSAALTWLKIKAWAFRTRKRNATTEALKFIAYRNESLALPKHHPAELPKGSTYRMTGTPMIFQLLRFVMSMGHTEARAMDYPLGLARWHWMANEEKEGRLCVHSEYDAHIERLRKGDSCPA